MKSGQAVLDRHAGPFTLMGWRRIKKDILQHAILAKAVPRDEVDDQAQMFLEDPRDTIDHITIWSESEEQIAYTYRKEDL